MIFFSTLGGKKVEKESGFNYFDFYFSHCQCQNTLNDEEKEKMTKVKNLLYVSVTRAIKNLRVLYVDETTNFNQGIKNLFGEIHSISM